MHSFTLSTPWVKNVYSLGILQGKTVGKLYTPMLKNTLLTTTPRVKPRIFNHLFNTKTPYLFTHYFKELNLLHTYLYTLSTPPTIKKIKGKKERNS